MQKPYIVLITAAWLILTGMLFGAGGDSAIAWQGAKNTPIRLSPCTTPKETPYRTISLKMSDCLNSGILDAVPPRYRPVASRFFHLNAIDVGMMTLLYSLPENVTNWDKDAISRIPWRTRYLQHIHAGPVWDKDGWMLNLVGHPLTGASYYVWARSTGLNWIESASLSALFSTVLWEYGWEALLEVPSIQDLILTPLAGSLIGEASYQLRQYILDNGGTVLGSSLLGDLVTSVLNPIGTINTQLDRIVKHLNKRAEVHANLFYSLGHPLRHTIPSAQPRYPSGRQGERMGIRITIRY